MRKPREKRGCVRARACTGCGPRSTSSKEVSAGGARDLWGQMSLGHQHRPQVSVLHIPTREVTGQVLFQGSPWSFSLPALSVTRGWPAVSIFLLPVTHVCTGRSSPTPTPSASSSFHTWLPRQRAWQTQRPWLQRDPRHSSFSGTGFSSSFPMQSATSMILFTQENKMLFLFRLPKVSLYV